MLLRGLTLVVAIFAVVLAAWVQELQRFRTNSQGVQWVNWIGEFGCGPDVVIERPSTLPELEAVVRQHKFVRAAATGHSFNPFACPTNSKGAVVDMRAFKKVDIHYEASDSQEATYSITAEAGITMGQLQNTILARGLTLRVPPGNSAYTLGGCIATGCHNLGQSHAQDLLAVTIMLYNGTVREIQRGDPDFSAAAVSMGMLGIILRASLQVLPYRSLQWSAEAHPIPGTDQVISHLENMTRRQLSRETVGNKLVFYLATNVMMVEHWVAMGRSASVNSDPLELPPYINSQIFRLGQGPLSAGIYWLRNSVFSLLPAWLLSAMQVPAEAAFRGLHTSPWLTKVRKVLGWQHSPEARGEASVKPTGNQYTWAGWLDEVMNLIMGLRHVEVIFPLEPKEQAEKCLDVVIAHKHLAWWRLNVRTQQSEGFLLSSTHAPAGSKPVFFLRVDFVGPGPLLDLPSGEASLTAQLHKQCPGWRKHWGKGLFATSAEERWGEPDEFRKVATRLDPEGKFHPRAAPTWLS